MPDLALDIHHLLLKTGVAVHYHYPSSFTHFPCFLFYETGNEVFARADSAPYLHEVEFTVEAWAQSVEETHALCVQADEKLTNLGFQRTYCCDLFDSSTRAHRRVMRYRALCDKNGTLTQ